MSQPHEELLIVEDVETLQRVQEYLNSPEFNYVAYDTETTGVEEDDRIVGWSIACEDGIGIYVPIATWEFTAVEADCTSCPPIELTKNGLPKKQRKCKACGDSKRVTTYDGVLVERPEMKAASRSVIASLLNKDLLMHNAPFDCKKTERMWGIQLMPAVHTDTMEAAHVLDENNSPALKEVGLRLFGLDATKEQREMKASVIANGGIWQDGPGGTKEMYKADYRLLGRYGAKDTILTFKVFNALVPQLFEEGLDQFFYEDESMPLMRGPTWHLNDRGLKVDLTALKKLERDLAEEADRLKAEVYEAIYPKVKETYPGTKPTNTFNIGASQQMAWLLFVRLGNEFVKLTDGGRELAKALVDRVPYNAAAKRAFIQAIHDVRRQAEEELAAIGETPKPPAGVSKEDRAAFVLALRTDPQELYRKSLRAKISKYKPHKFFKADKDVLENFAKKYEWVPKLLRYSQCEKIRSTYCEGILRLQRYGVIYPNFRQSGTTSGRYSSSNPNFQNLPKKDKRVKACIVSRPGHVFVGADYSQLEPRCFASTSQDPDLMACFAKGEDFYSVVGIPIFKDFSYSMIKDEKDPNSWATACPKKRDIAKAFALATPYGTTAYQQADKLRDEEGNRLTPQQCQDIIDSYFEAYPAVKQMQRDSHVFAMTHGYVTNLFGRPRRIPEAMAIGRRYGLNVQHADLPYNERTYFNLAMNHRVQSTAASIVNRAMIALYKKFLELGLDARIVLQVHDEIVVECREEDAQTVAYWLQHCMENTVTLPGVTLVAEPKIARNLADLK